MVALREPGQAEPPLEERPPWRKVYAEPFLSHSNSRWPWRSFWVPGLSHARNVWGEYQLLRNTRLLEKLEARGRPRAL